MVGPPWTMSVTHSSAKNWDELTPPYAVSSPSTLVSSPSVSAIGVPNNRNATICLALQQANTSAATPSPSPTPVLTSLAWRPPPGKKAIATSSTVKKSGSPMAQVPTSPSSSPAETVQPATKASAHSSSKQ